MSQVRVKSETSLCICWTNDLIETTKRTANSSNMYELRLRPHVHWTEDTIDNEHLHHRSSKSMDGKEVLMSRMLYLS